MHNLLLSESEKNRIKNIYNISPVSRNYIFETTISVDNRYVIIMDEVFDIIEKKKIGYLWESIDVFKTLFSNIEIKNNEEYKKLKESILNIPILESNSSLYNLRDILLEFNFFDDTWLGSNLKNAGNQILNTAKQSWEGIKKLGVAISEGDWKELLTLLAKGVKFILRKLKDAMYSSVGMIVDAILVATGVGKSVQWIPWALITALDIYQIANNDWPKEDASEPMWMKYMTLGFDILGLVTTGALSNVSRKMFLPFKNMKLSEAAIKINANPKLKNIILTIKNNLSKVPNILNNAAKIVSKKFPKGGQFIQNGLNYFKNIVNQFTNILNTLLGIKATSALKAAATTGGVLYGFDKGIELYNNNTSDLTKLQTQNLETFSKLANKYGDKDPFDD